MLQSVYLNQLTFEPCVCFSSLMPIKLFAFIPLPNCHFFLACTHQSPASLKVTTSSATLPQILAKRKINNKSDNLLLCLPAYRHNNHQPIPNRGGVACTRCVPALSSLCIFWMKQQVKHLPACRAVLCSAQRCDCASEGKSDLRLGIVAVTLCHTGSAFGRGGGCLQREEVSQAVVDGGESKTGGGREQFSALLNIS